MNNLFSNLTFNTKDNNYKKSIHEALYPRSNWSGGYIIANVFDNGRRIVLQGYTQPSSEEAAILRIRIEKCLNAQPEIFWKSIGSENEILLILNESSNQLTLQKQVTDQLNSLLRAIYKRASQDIETVRKIPNATIEGLNTAKYSTIQYSQQGFVWAQESCNQIIDGSLKVIEPLKQELIEYPQKWIGDLNKSITIKITLAKDSFNIIKQNYKGKNSEQLATFIIIESLKKSTLARFVDSGIYDIGKSVSNWVESLKFKDYPFLSSELSQSVDDISKKIREAFEQPKTSDLMLSMIIQIACAYERADFSSPERQGELVSIIIISYLCSLAVDADFADLRKNITEQLDLKEILQGMGLNNDLDIVNTLQKGINSAKHLNPFQEFLVSLGMNMALFLVVGFITKYIYQNYENIGEILLSINLFNQIKNQASKSVLEIKQNTNIVEDVIVDCYQIEKVE